MKYSGISSIAARGNTDAKFGTPYSLPAATVSTLGGVKVGDYLDIAPDGTLSGKTLYDTIAASVAVKSEARLVWNTTKNTGTKWKTCDFQVPDNVDLVRISLNGGSLYTLNAPDLARGSNVTCRVNGSDSTVGYDLGLDFRAAGTLRITYEPTSTYQNPNSCTFTVSGYHYPTLADLLTETQAAQADADALNLDQDYRLTLLELGVTDDETTETA